MSCDEPHPDSSATPRIITPWIGTPWAVFDRTTRTPILWLAFRGRILVGGLFFASTVWARTVRVDHGFLNFPQRILKAEFSFFQSWIEYQKKSKAHENPWKRFHPAWTWNHALRMLKWSQSIPRNLADGPRSVRQPQVAPKGPVRF